MTLFSIMVGRIGTTRLAERGSTILLASTKWSVWTLLAGGVFVYVGTDVRLLADHIIAMPWAML